MGQAPWNARATSVVKKTTVQEEHPLVPSESDETRAARLERLQAEIAAGTYGVSAESLAAKLARRMRWW